MKPDRKTFRGSMNPDLPRNFHSPPWNAHADPTLGADSALYEAMGYTRRSERKSGLTRKRNEPSTK
jgi:hypothetical protein